MAKGQFVSGDPRQRPGGRPKAVEGFAEAMRAHATDARNVLIGALSDDDSRVRIMAAREILDRGFGRPAQTIDQTVHESPSIFVIGYRDKSATTTPSNGNGNGKSLRIKTAPESDA